MLFVAIAASILLYGAIVATCAMTWLNRHRIRGLENEIEQLRAEIHALRQPQDLAPLPLIPSVEDRPVPEVYPEIDTTASSQDHPTPPAESPPAPAEHLGDIPPTEVGTALTPAAIDIGTLNEAPDRRSGWEFDIGAKLPVWVGAVSLICAAFFLIRYSIDAGWLGPKTRDGLGFLFGMSMMAAAQWMVGRPQIANHLRIAQGLAGAGIVTLYFCFYAAVNLHQMLSPSAGFGGMAAVTAAAVVLSLRHGQPIAAFGLIGGLLTPALVGSQEPDTGALFSYLFLLFGGILMVLARRGWWILAVLGLAGLFVWMGFWFVFEFASADAFAVSLFVLAICGVVLATAAKYGVHATHPAEDLIPAHTLNILALGGGAVTLMMLGSRLSLSLFDWSTLQVLSLGCVALAWFSPTIYMPALFAKLCGDLLMLIQQAPSMALTDSAVVVAAMAGVYVGIPGLAVGKLKDPRLWAVLQAAASIALYLVAYFFIPFPGHEQTGLWGGIGLALAALATRQTSFVRRNDQADAVVRDHLTAIYAFAATSLLSIGLAIELPWQWLPLAFATEMAATVWIGQATEIAFLRTITAILCLVFIGLNAERIELYVRLVATSLLAQPFSVLDEDITDHLFIRLVLPALMAAFALILHRRRERASDPLSHLLFGTALALVLDAGYVLIRTLFLETVDEPAGFIERGVITTGLLVCALSIFSFGRAFGQDFLSRWSRILLHLTMLRILWFDLLIHNPMFDSSQLVGNLPVANGVALTYGAGLLLSIFAATGPAGESFAIRSIYKALGFILLFALVTLEVRQAFHGSLLADQNTSHAEFYTYSFAWLLTGLALLAVGIVLPSRTARMASLAFLLLTTGKVFLLDADELEGLYRVFSFLGLGISLIGLSFFYTRFILKAAQPREGKANHSGFESSGQTDCSRSAPKRMR